MKHWDIYPTLVKTPRIYQFYPSFAAQLSAAPGERAAELAKKAKDLPPPSRGISMEDVPWAGAAGASIDFTRSMKIQWDYIIL